MGDWYIISTSTKAVTALYSDIVALARETDVLMPHEYFNEAV
jgi:hypothetical protein